MKITSNDVGKLVLVTSLTVLFDELDMNTNRTMLTKDEIAILLTLPDDVGWCRILWRFGPKYVYCNSIKKLK